MTLEDLQRIRNSGWFNTIRDMDDEIDLGEIFDLAEAMLMLEEMGEDETAEISIEHPRRYWEWSAWTGSGYDYLPREGLTHETADAAIRAAYKEWKK